MIRDDQEYLTRCVVDPISRRFNLYSSLGDEKVVECETVDEFMNILSFVKETITEDNIATLAYSNML